MARYHQVGMETKDMGGGRCEGKRLWKGAEREMEDTSPPWAKIRGCIANKAQCWDQKPPARPHARTPVRGSVDPYV